MTSPLHGLQFDDARIAVAQAQPIAERRVRGYTARKTAAKRDATTWAVGVDHSSHEDLQQGITARARSHILLSREHYPDALEAEEIAYLWGTARGTYPTKVEHAER